MIQTRCGDQAETAFVASIIDGAFTIADLEPGGYQRSLELMLAYPNLHLGLVDATIVTIAEHADTDQIASLNGRDFYVVRPNMPRGSSCSPKASRVPPDRHQPNQFCKAEPVPAAVVSGAVEARKHASAFFGGPTPRKRSLIGDARRCSARSPARRVRSNVATHVRCGYLLNNRYLDASTGTFLSVDPLIGKTGQAYLYAGGNPTTYSDPSGLEPGSWNNTAREYWVWQFFWKLNKAQPMAARERIAAACQGGCSQPPSKDFVNVGGRQYQVFDSPEEVEHEYLDDTRELLERRLAGHDTGLGRVPGGKASESIGLISDGAAVVALGCLGFWWLAGSGLACAGAAGTVSAAAGAAEAVALWVEDGPAKECKTAAAAVSAVLPAPGSAARPLVEATFGVTRVLTGFAAGQAC